MTCRPQLSPLLMPEATRSNDIPWGCAALCCVLCAGGGERHARPLSLSHTHTHVGAHNACHASPHAREHALPGCMCSQAQSMQRPAPTPPARTSNTGLLSASITASAGVPSTANACWRGLAQERTPMGTRCAGWRAVCVWCGPPFHTARMCTPPYCPVHTHTHTRTHTHTHTHPGAHLCGARHVCRVAREIPWRHVGQAGTLWGDAAAAAAAVLELRQ
jgi:hypothetical protein